MALSFLSAAESLWAYTVNCDPNSDSILSVLGETRPPTNPFTRYHTGVDLDGCNDTEPVNVIAGGRVEYVPECGIGDDACRRVVAADGSAFDYLHITDARVVGSTISVGEQIGVISGGHLHLAQIQRVGTFAINPQFPGQLTFDRTADPLPTYMDITVGGVTDSVIPVQAFNQDAFPNQTPVPFTKASNGVYYLRGDVDVLVTVNAQPFVGANDRKGVFMVGVLVLQAGSLNRLFDGRANIPFQTIVDQVPNGSGLKTIYYSAQAESRTYWATNLKINNVAGMQAMNSQWSSGTAPEGAIKLCGVVKNFPGANELWNCKDAVIDRSNPTVTLKDTSGNTFTYATSSTTIVVQGDDANGVYSLKLEGPSYSSTSYVSGVQTSAQATFPTGGSLADGSYTATVTDLAGNAAEASFQIRTEPANPERKDDEGNDYQSPGASTTSFFCKWSSPAGIKKVTFGTMVYDFTCPDNTSVTIGPFANLPPGNHACSGETCAGVTSSTSISVNAGTYQMELSAYSDGTSTVTNTVTVDSGSIVGNLPSIRIRSACTGTFPAFDLACKYIGGTYESDCFVINDGCQYAYRDVSGKSASVTNSTTTSPPFGLEFKSTLGSYSVSVGGLSYTQTGNARVKVSQAGQNYPREGPDGKFGGNLGYKGGNIGPTGYLPQWLRDILNRAKRALDTIVESVTGSDIVFTSTGTINFTLTGVTAATDTMRIYQWTTAGWSSGTVTDQTISLSSTGVLRATGTVSTGGYFVLLYDGSDSSAPVTGFNIQGSSFVFDTTLFLSTYSYVVFVATDPAVNGFASGAATSYYRLDPDSTTAYTAYTSSIPVPLGFHTIQYYSVDYAGNAEAPKISSFVVTAGSVFRASEGMRAPGGVLAGFLGSGAQAEVVSAAENDLTVRVSSQNGTPLFTVNNIGGVGMGTDLALGHVDIQGRGSSGETALLLRSGSAAGGSQVQFGYNGDVSMRHQLKTRHSTAAYGNALDFLVWNPGAGSTTTAADLGALSLEGSTLTASGALAHVHPAGQADEELVVSDGLTMGGGTIHRLAAYAPSSLRFKSSVRRLGTREEDRAFEETAALRPARFRYKGEPAGAPLRLGLIYEDAPESLRAEGKTVSVDERVANLELALKASMRRLEALQKRLRELEAP